MTRIIPALSAIADAYEVLLVDLWGCVHDGVQAFPEAVAALRRFRDGGGTVVLLTNSPKPRAGVAVQLAGFGVPDDCYDLIATSGDSARAAMFTGAVGQRVYFMGEEARDAEFFAPLKVLDDPLTVERVDLDSAEGIVCCGPFDPMADPETSRPDLEAARARGLKLLCANPDIVVDRGERREWCAGAIARLYTEMGGESLYFGKPHAPIYDLARRRLAAAGRLVPDEKILAIGDGLGTDVAGAAEQGIDCLFITGGLSARETGTTDQPDPGALERHLHEKGAAPEYAIGRLR